MKLKHLKKLRIVISLIFFFAVTFLFLDYRNLIPYNFFGTVLYLQFIPSVVKAFTVISFAAAGFILVLILTFFFGRVYCSTICPLGILQDFISNFYRRFKKKKFYHKAKSYSWLRYSFLVIAAVSLFSGSLFALYLLDPYSNYGRILSSLVKPAVLFFNNILAFSLENFGIYSLYPLEIKGITFFAISFPLFVLILVTVLAIKNGRLFCNTVCPVGTFLGLISKFSLYQININKDKCNSCKLCERVCKAGCIDKKNQLIDFERCVSCYNCFTACHSSAIEFKNHYKKPEKIFTEPDYNKREFISKTFIYFLGLTGLSFAQNKITPKKESTIPVVKKNPVTPPGSKKIKHFNKHCTACGLCVSVCPTGVLQPSYLEYGFLGMMQPVMDFKTGFCNFDCIACSEVCPTGAIEKILPEKKHLTQIGKAIFVKENCIVYTENTACGACSEHCPTKAVHMIPYKNITIPEVRDEFCVGCGACEYACPTKPYKAIYVEGNPLHLTAKKNEEEKLEVDEAEGFPF